MRRIIGALLALLMVVSAVGGAAAQSSYSSGMNAPATWVDERGNPVASVEVTDVIVDWQEYDEFSTPDRGYIFTVVSFAVTNLTDAPVSAEPYSFSLIDSTGMNISSGWAAAAEDADVVLTEEPVELDAGDSADMTLAFEMYADSTPAMLMWQPDSGRIVMVSIGEGNAIAQGLNTPATWTDERGNDVATIEVLGIEEDWQDYGEFEEPSRGTSYLAMQVSVTNISDDIVTVAPYSFSLVDSESANTMTAWVSGNDTVAEELLTVDVVLEPGDSLEGTIVFAVYSGVAPTALLWQPEWGTLSIVVVADGAAPDGGATPVASPAS